MTKIFLSLCCILIGGFMGIAEANEPIQPIPNSIEIDESKFNIGLLLFFDENLSKNNNVSCASCHKASEGLAENIPFSTSSLGKLRKRNSQSLFNTTYFSYLHWDGTFTSLNDLGLRGMKSATSNEWGEILIYLKSSDVYLKHFKAVFDDGITKLNVALALAEYQKSFITPNSPFDLYLKGDIKAINEQQIQGYRLFKNYGCISCHNSMTIGGQMFAKLGQFGDYFKDRGNVTKTDYGRFNRTKLEADRYRFRVPSLRNVALTAPYFHDASQKTLNEAVQTMAMYQLGRHLSDEDTDALVSFLESLTGVLKRN